MDPTETAVHQQSTSSVKIALFRSLFGGRDDLYARRFESRKTGKSGYAPACANEWVRGRDRVLPLRPGRPRLPLFQRSDSGRAGAQARIAILTETTERRPDVGLDSYDRFFPSQDTLPQGGFGNLIALPLQKQARERGNSIFLDDDLVPHSDQWAFLAAVRTIDHRVEGIVRNAELRGRVVGVRLPPVSHGRLPDG